MDTSIPPPQTRQERRQLARAQRREEGRMVQRKRGVWRWLKIGLVISAFIVVFVWLLKQPSPTQDPLDEIISSNGLHWHSTLSIVIDGKKQDVPANIGIGAVHQPIHTHDDKDVIHMEFSGVVRARDLQLGQFFRNWEKTFSPSCIFDRCTGADGSLKMRVNGQENTEFERYQMKDGDVIEIVYE